MRSRELAEDLVQEVFWRVWRLWPRLEIGDGMRSYLYKATRARALNALAKERSESNKRRRYEAVSLVTDGSATRPECEVHIARATRRLRERLPTLLGG